MISRITQLALAAGAVALVVAAGGAALAGTATAAEVVASPVLHVPPPPLRLGQDLTVTITPDGLAPDPARYAWSDNGGRVRTVRATAGTASFTITLATRTNLLSVQGVAADGQTSPAVSRYVIVDLMDPPAADQDSTGDGRPDLMLAGTPGGLGSGLWLAAGRTGGRLRTPAVDIAPDGPQGTGPDGGLSFDGARIIVGDFFGAGFQDVLAYYPDGANAGGGFLISGSGDGEDLKPGVSPNERNISAGTFSDINGDNPVELANAYNASGTSPGGPDLIAIAGDPTAGYHLEYLAAQGSGALNYTLPAQLPDLTPAGDTDWSSWRLASTRLASGTALYLWNPTTGVLYLWERLSFVDNGDFTGTLTHTTYQISTSWNPGADLTLQAGDVTGDGVPDLWAVDPTGVATAWVVTNLSTTATARITPEPAQDLR